MKKIIAVSFVSFALWAFSAALPQPAGIHAFGEFEPFVPFRFGMGNVDEACTTSRRSTRPIPIRTTASTPRLDVVRDFIDRRSARLAGVRVVWSRDDFALTYRHGYGHGGLDILPRQTQERLMS